MNEICLRVEVETEILRGELEPADAVPTPPPPADWAAHHPSAAKPRAEDRRVCLRHPSTNGRGWLGWYEGVAFRQVAAWVLNISASGCLVAADEAPPDGCSIWLRAETPDCPDWAETRVIGRLPSRDGMHAARLVFRGTCPYALMKVVAFGPAQACQIAHGPARSWDLNSW